MFSVDDIKAVITPIAEKHRLKAVYLLDIYPHNNDPKITCIDLLYDGTGAEIRSLSKVGELYLDMKEALGTEIDLNIV